AIYGTERFYQHLKESAGESVRDLVATLVQSLMDFGLDAKPQDDITVLGLEFKNDRARRLSASP
ncbi:MAG: SpoIIE family protein phosphatase, partial [Desulfobacterales bacterium]